MQVASPSFRTDRPSSARRQSLVIGVDEVGRGAVAGPLLVCAACLPAGVPPEAHGLTDSKRLTRLQRERIAEVLSQVPHAFAWRSAGEVDANGIRACVLAAMAEEATCLSWERTRIGLRADDLELLFDGRDLPDLPGVPAGCARGTVVGGDARVPEIAAASVLAKVTRDRHMAGLGAGDPRYGFGRHAGYGTAAHLAAVREHGPTPEHRLTFLRKIVSR